MEILNQRRIEAKRQLDKKAAAAAQDLIEAAAAKKRGVDPVFNRNLWSSEQSLLISQGQNVKDESWRQNF